MNLLSFLCHFRQSLFTCLSFWDSRSMTKVPNCSPVAATQIFKIPEQGAPVPNFSILQLIQPLAWCWLISLMHPWTLSWKLGLSKTHNYIIHIDSTSSLLRSLSIHFSFLLFSKYCLGVLTLHVTRNEPPIPKGNKVEAVIDTMMAL